MDGSVRQSEERGGAIDARSAQPLALLFAYALAWAGGSIAYAPFLTALLPQRLTLLAGAQDVRWLGIVATVGAVTASLSNVAWGWLSDRVGRRLRLTAIGLVAFAITSASIVRSATPLALVAAVAVWQVALNLILAPLAAYAADRVPDAQKGLLGGLLAVGPGIAATSLVLVSFLPGRLDAQMAVIVAITIAAFAPLFFISKSVASPAAVAPIMASSPGTREILLRLWFARLAVQVAEGLLFLFLYYALRRLGGGTLDLGRYAMTTAVAQVVAIPVALGIGRWSDRRERRRGPLLAMIALIALGLVTMASSASWAGAAIGYALFLIGSNSFLCLHSTFAMQQLRDPRHFGRDLGLFNLTNTLPALVTPMIAVGVIGAVGYPGLLLCLALFMAAPAMLVAGLEIDGAGVAPKGQSPPC